MIRIPDDTKERKQFGAPFNARIAGSRAKPSQTRKTLAEMMQIGITVIIIIHEHALPQGSFVGFLLQIGDPLMLHKVPRIERGNARIIYSHELIFILP